MSESYKPDADALPEPPYDTAFLVSYPSLVGCALFLKYSAVTKRSGVKRSHQLCYHPWYFFDSRMLSISQI